MYKHSKNKTWLKERSIRQNRGHLVDDEDEVRFKSEYKDQRKPFVPKTIIRKNKDKEKMNEQQERPEDRTIFCKMCKEDRVHMDLELRGNCRWKCKSCGEYNQPEFQDSIAEQILDPLESVYVNSHEKEN